MKRFFLILFIFTFLLPVILAAADFATLVNKTISSFFDPFVLIIFSLAFIAFFWNAVKLISGSDTPLDLGDGKKGPSARNKAKQRMMWGLITMFVMFSIWGILSILKDSFDLNENPINTYPEFYLNN